MTTYISKSQAAFITQYYSYFIGNTMNSEYFLKQLGIKGLEEFDPASSSAKEWITSLRDLEKIESLPADKTIDAAPFNLHIPNRKKMSIQLNEYINLENRFLFMEPSKMAQINITLNEEEIYKSPDWDKTNTPYNIFRSDNVKGQDLFSKLINYFETESVYDLYDSNNNNIGSVSVRIDSGFIFITFVSMVVIVGLIGLLCLFTANIFSRFFTISITKPLNQLDEKIKAIASGDYISTMNAHIVLKKPLMEIESLAYSTNKIMLKMKEYNDLLESQKVILENQNGKLENQNVELTESKHQVEETRALLVQTEKMASIGQLTAAITHEINTPLGAINSNAQLFDMLLSTLNTNTTVNSDEELAGVMAQMKETNDINVMACERVIKIIKNLKTFTKLDQAEFQEADINEGIKSVLVLTSNLWKTKITMHEEYGNIPLIKCFSGLMNQVFMNIMVNAIQSIEDRGEIYIRTYTDENNVYASIRDTGCGIRKEHLPHIFDVGFSTKNAGVGAGLGLSICNNIIKKHKGEIKVSSEAGRGTEFIVCIPLSIESGANEINEEPLL